MLLQHIYSQYKFTVRCSNELTNSYQSPLPIRSSFTSYKVLLPDELSELSPSDSDAMGSNWYGSMFTAYLKTNSQANLGSYSVTFPANYSLTQKRRNVKDNSDVTKKSLNSIPSVKLGGHFGNVSLEPSGYPRIFNFFTPFHGSKRKISS